MPLVKMPLTGVVIKVTDEQAADERFMDFLMVLDRRRHLRMRFRQIGKRGSKEEDSQTA